MKHDDGFDVDNAELAACALINLENLARMVPNIKTHPMYEIAHSQLNAVSARLDKELEAA